MMWVIAVKILVNAKKMESVNRGVAGSSTALVLSEHCVEIVGFAQDCLFSDVKQLG